MSEPRQHPALMGRYGKNPYGQNLYRIVFAPTRMYQIESEKGLRWFPLYRTLGNVWVMEKWRPAAEFAGCSREHWPPILGPWPERGEYQLCHVFEACGPDDANIETLIKLIEIRHRFYDLQQWHRQDAERELKQNRTTAEDMIRNKLPAFGGRVLSSSRIQRGTKTLPLLLTAQEAGLPTKPGLHTKPNKPIEIQQEP